MVKRKALMKSLSSNLHSFLEKTNKICQCRIKNSCGTVSSDCYEPANPLFAGWHDIYRTNGQSLYHDRTVLINI